MSDHDVRPGPGEHVSTEHASTEPADADDLTDSGPATEPEAPGQGPPAPETGDLVIDAALRDLAEAPEDDLDAQVERGEQVQRTLQGRLSDLGG